MANLLDEASILLSATAYNNGSMLAVKPENGDGDFTFSRNSAATRVNAQGLVENVAINLPRIDYTDGCGNWLLEPQSTNLYLNSDILATQSNATNASEYTVSFYGTGNITFSGTHIGTLVGTGANNRVSATFTATSGTLTSTISGSCTKGQLENLNYASSYIPTNDYVTRVAETANGAGNASNFGSEGVLFAEISALVDDGTKRSIAITDGTVNNIIVIRYNSYPPSGQKAIDALYVNNNGVPTSAAIFYSDSTDFTKIALSYQQGALKLYVNGTLERTTPLVVNDAINWNTLQFNIGNGTQDFYGNVRQVAVYKTALTDEQLTELTTI